MARSKGEGAVYRDGDGWRAVVELPPDPTTGKRRRRYLRAPSKAAAIRRVREAQSALAAATPVASPSLRLSQWLATWIDRDVAPVRKPATTAGYRSDTARHINPVIGSRPLASLTQSDVRAVHAAVAAKGLSAASVARVHRTLSAALTAAERDDLVTRNVARLVSPPPVSRRTPPALTAEQARTYLASRRGRPDYLRRLIAFHLGARQGEVLGITLDNLHLDAPTPSVELAWEVRRVTWAHGCGPADADRQRPCGRRRGVDCPDRLAPVPPHLEAEQVHGGLWLLRPKTAGSWRHVALTPTIIEAAGAHLQAARPRRFLFEAAPGVPVDPRDDHAQWVQGLVDAGLPRVRLHSARSTAATLLLERDAPQRLIMEILGHTQAATTAHYQQPSLDYQARALAAATAPLQAPSEAP